MVSDDIIAHGLTGEGGCRCLRLTYSQSTSWQQMMKGLLLHREVGVLLSAASCECFPNMQANTKAWINTSSQTGLHHSETKQRNKGQQTHLSYLPPDLWSIRSALSALLPVFFRAAVCFGVHRAQLCVRLCRLSACGHRPPECWPQKACGRCIFALEIPGECLEGSKEMRKNGLLAIKPDGGRHMRWGEEEQ